MLGAEANPNDGMLDCQGTGCGGDKSLPTQTTMPICSWYQERISGVCKFSTTNTVHTLFQLPGSVVVGLINPKATVLSETMITLSTAISLIAWGGAAYYLYRRFTGK